MASCEKCWRDAGGDSYRYAELVKQSNCTPEEQAGQDDGRCYVCGRKTMHQHCHVCMNPSCRSNVQTNTPSNNAPTENGAATGPDVDQLRIDLEFIAKMLHVRIVEQRQTDSFYVCEAWEVAKKYYSNKD